MGTFPFPLLLLDPSGSQAPLGLLDLGSAVHIGTGCFFVIFAGAALVLLGQPLNRGLGQGVVVGAVVGEDIEKPVHLDLRLGCLLRF